MSKIPQSIPRSKIARIQVYIPSKWIPIIEKYMQKHGYWTASEAIRDLIRDHIIKPMVGDVRDE